MTAHVPAEVMTSVITAFTVKFVYCSERKENSLLAILFRQVWYENTFWDQLIT